MKSIINIFVKEFKNFAFFNSGPSWNMLVNPSPWLRGFPDPVSRKGDEINKSIIQIEKWRKKKDDMLVIFMHSPPLNRIFPHTGPYKEFCFRFTKDNIIINSMKKIYPTDWK